MHGKDIHTVEIERDADQRIIDGLSTPTLNSRIVDPHRDLESGGQVGTSSGDETDESGGRGPDESSSWGDGDESVAQR